MGVSRLGKWGCGNILLLECVATSWSILDPVFCLGRGKKQQLPPTFHLPLTITDLPVTPQPALPRMKQPLDLPLHHPKSLDLAHPCCASWMFSEPGAAENCDSGICMGPQQYFLSWPFPEIIHYSSAIPLLGAGAGSEPSTAHAKPGLRCVQLRFHQCQTPPPSSPQR